MFWCTRFPNILDCFDQGIIEWTWDLQWANRPHRRPHSRGFDGHAVGLSVRRFEEWSNGGIHWFGMRGPSAMNHRLGWMWLWTRWAGLSLYMNSRSRSFWSRSFCHTKCRQLPAMAPIRMADRFPYEKRYLYGRKAPVPSTCDAVEALLRHELLAHIPEWLAKKVDLETMSRWLTSRMHVWSWLFWPELEPENFKLINKWNVHNNLCQPRLRFLPPNPSPRVLQRRINQCADSFSNQMDARMEITASMHIRVPTVSACGVAQSRTIPRLVPVLAGNSLRDRRVSSQLPGRPMVSRKVKPLPLEDHIWLSWHATQYWVWQYPFWLELEVVSPTPCHHHGCLHWGRHL